MTLGGLSNTANRIALALLAVTVDDDGHVQKMGTPPTVVKTLCFVTGMKRAAIERGLKELAVVGIVEATRKGVPAVMHIRVVRKRIGAVGLLCEVCSEPTKGTGRWCAKHKQENRQDRTWQRDALELFDAGKPTLAIAARLGRPHYIAAGADGRNPNGGAIVPFLLGQGRELPADVLEGYKNATRGDLEPAVDVLLARRR